MGQLSSLDFQLCRIQGRLFQLACNLGYDCSVFVALFMNSQCATDLDKPFDRLQWAGEEYILSELNDSVEGGLPKAKTQYNDETMYWIGYVYRYWHYYRDASSRDIYKIANFKTMRLCYLGYHTLDPAMAVDRLLEARATA